MNGAVIIFLLLNGSLLLTVSERWAALVFLVGATYLNLGHGIELGPLHFPPLRLLIALGFIRIIMRGERLAGKMNRLDWLMLGWTAWALFSSLFHRDVNATLINRLGLIYNACGVYFFLRISCRSLQDVIRLCRMLAVLLTPIALGMLFERATGHNLFSILGGVSDISEVRNNGRVRAQGPFDHSILAGTVGATSFPLMVGLWNQHRKTAIAGIAACIAIVFASSSSGPIMSAVVAALGLIMWLRRRSVRFVRWLALLTYIGLDIVMKAPAYYILARIDLTGSSTGWHRAALIETAFNHLEEWWMVGTDYTRHWLDYGVAWSPDHIDITNHYLRMAVDGGLPLMLLFIAIIGKGFSLVGQTLRQEPKLPAATQFMIWTLGASLLAHATTFISVSYFDQSFVFIYLTLAAICSGSVPVTKTADALQQPMSEPCQSSIPPRRIIYSRRASPKKIRTGASHEGSAGISVSSR